MPGTKEEGEEAVKGGRTRECCTGSMSQATELAQGWETTGREHGNFPGQLGSCPLQVPLSAGEP